MGSSETSTPAPSAAAAVPPLTWHPLVPRSIAGLMLLTLACAGLFAVHLYARDASLELEDIAATALLGFGTLVAIGLLQQARDLWRYRRELSLEVAQPVDDESEPHDQALPSRRRFSALLGIAFRVATAILLVSTLVADAFLDEPDYDVGYRHEQFHLFATALPLVWLFVALAFARHAQRIARLPVRRRSQVFGGIVLLVLCGAFLVLLYEFGAVNYLVFIAIRGIELCGSPAGKPFLPDAAPDVIARVRPAFLLTCWAIPVGAVAIGTLWQAARRRSSRWLIAAIISGLAYAFVVGWNVLVNAPAADPLFISVSSGYDTGERLVNGGPLVLLVGAVIAIRCMKQPLSKVRSTAPLQELAAAYPVAWHERALLQLGTVTAALLSFGFADSLSKFAVWLMEDLNWSWLFKGIIPYDVQLTIVEPFEISQFLPGNVTGLAVALTIFCLTLAWRGRGKRLANSPVRVPDVGAPRQFALVWLLATVWVLATIPQLCFMAFMVHLRVWFI